MTENQNTPADSTDPLEYADTTAQLTALAIIEAMLLEDQGAIDVLSTMPVEDVMPTMVACLLIGSSLASRASKAGIEWQVNAYPDATAVVTDMLEDRGLEHLADHGLDDMWQQAPALAAALVAPVAVADGASVRVLLDSLRAGIVLRSQR